MKLIFDVFAYLNLMGCVIAMVLMAYAYSKEDLEKTQPDWNRMAFMCFAFCLFGMLREVYSLLHSSKELVAAWPFKFTTSGIFLMTIMFYRLTVRSSRMYVSDDND